MTLLYNDVGRMAPKPTGKPIAKVVQTSMTEVVVTAVDVATGTFTAAAHGLTNGMRIFATLNTNAGQTFLTKVTPGSINHAKYFVIDATANTFRLSTTSGGGFVQTTSNVDMDLTKWHFEAQTGDAGRLDIINLPPRKKYRAIVYGKLGNGDTVYLHPTGWGSGGWLGTNAGYNIPNTSIGGSMFFYNDVLFDSSRANAAYFKSVGFYVNHSSATAVSHVHVNTSGYNPTLGGTDITSLAFTVNIAGAFLNGTTVEVYEVVTSGDILGKVGSEVRDSGVNGNIVIDGAETKVYDDTAVVSEVNSKKGKLLASASYSGNPVINVSAVDTTTDMFTASSHGLLNGDRIFPFIKDGVSLGSSNPNTLLFGGCTYPVGGYYVINSAGTTFQISLTAGGTAVDLTPNATMDLTKWHFEKSVGVGSFDISGLTAKRLRFIISGKSLDTNAYTYLSVYLDGVNAFAIDWIYNNSASGQFFPTWGATGNLYTRGEVIVESTPSHVAIQSKVFTGNLVYNGNIAHSSVERFAMNREAEFVGKNITRIVPNFPMANGSSIEVFEA